MSFLLSSRLLPQKSLWDWSSDFKFFLPFPSVLLFGIVLDVHLAPFTQESPHLKALPHAHITSALFHHSPLLWQGRKLNVKEDLQARELCRGRAFLFLG